MNEDQKFWLNIFTISCITVLLLVLLGLYGCRQCEETNRTAIQNGYHKDSGGVWAK